jgi:LysR family transcriptional regulator, glycine cleavage system transcriptional activator
VANGLIAEGRLVRLFDYSLPMKEAYYLISPEGSLINPAAKAFKTWLMQEIKGG